MQSENLKLIPIYEIQVKNYSLLRKEAIEQSRKMPTSHPCRRGLGICCQEETIPVSQDDQKRIISAIQNGKISKQVFMNAQRNAQNPTWKSCAFYNPGKGLCNIYDDRPLICISTGTGALTSEEYPNVIQDALKRTESSGKDSGVPIALTKSSMCSQCHDYMAGCDMRFSTEGMIRFNEALLHYGDKGFKPMKEFIANVKIPKTR